MKQVQVKDQEVQGQSLMDGAQPAQLTALDAIFLKPGAHSEGRAKWRPVAKIGHNIVVFWDHLETNRQKALAYARPKVEAIVQAGYDVFGKKDACEQ